MASQNPNPRADGFDGFGDLLDYLKRTRGFDFSGYKRPSLERRIRKRMALVEIDEFGDYQDHLEVTPEEFTELFNTILINVTDFFRDKPAWDHLAEVVIPRLLEDVPDPDPIRVWSAACATGEEAYTIAMVLAEQLGEETFRRRVKIYATDVDEDALASARHAVYPREALKAVPDSHRQRYFESGPTGYGFRSDLRRSVIFGRNDLVQDAPISRVDLLVSRNALMYFTPEAQARILAHFNFALKDTGFLFLGKSEMLITHSDLFTPDNLKWRVFRKVLRTGIRDRLAFVSDGDADQPQRYMELRNGALDVTPLASVLVDRGGFVTSINQAARGLFSLGTADVGRPFQDLELSYRPLDLRSGLEQAYAEGAPTTLGRVPWTTGSGEQLILDVAIAPVPSPAGRPLGAAISFQDVTELAQLDEEHERSRRELETAYEELQSTVEELETTNEELHSTNEELETTNEELQSSNEELETMNEELQSTNDELETMNDEQGVRTAELDKVNLFFEGILGNLGVGVVVLDSDQTIEVWNANSSELWGVRGNEVHGQNFFDLDIGLPVGELEDPIRRVQSGDTEETEVDLEAVTRRGRSERCRVRVLALRAADGMIHGTVMLMSTRDELMAST